MVRVDFNVPVVNNVVEDDFRIRAALPTINFLCQKGAKVILICHLETNEGQNISLKPVSLVLQKLGVENLFIEDYKNAHQLIENQMQNGSVALLENLRFFEGEKNNDSKFAKELASLGDIFVNEAFPVSHREHASIVGVPKYLDSYVGLQFQKEITNLSKAFEPARPFLFVLGGAKFQTKIPLLDKFSNKADSIFIGGALANDFFAQKGYQIGKSVTSGAIDLSAFVNNPKILLPLDIVTDKKQVCDGQTCGIEERIMDIGPKSREFLIQKIKETRFILWNGPLGFYEKGFKDGTKEIANFLGKYTAESSGQVTSIVGGGDTVAAIKEIGNEGQFTFVSTGGGAMLDFLAKGTLPGIEVLGN